MITETLRALNLHFRDDARFPFYSQPRPMAVLGFCAERACDHILSELRITLEALLVPAGDVHHASSDTHAIDEMLFGGAKLVPQAALAPRTTYRALAVTDESGVKFSAAARFLVSHDEESPLFDEGRKVPLPEKGTNPSSSDSQLLDAGKSFVQLWSGLHADTLRRVAKMIKGAGYLSFFTPPVDGDFDDDSLSFFAVFKDYANGSGFSVELDAIGTKVKHVPATINCRVRHFSEETVMVNGKPINRLQIVYGFTSPEEKHRATITTLEAVFPALSGVAPVGGAGGAAALAQ